MSIIPQKKKKMVKIQTLDETKRQVGNGATGTSVPCHWECIMIKFFWKTIWWFLTKLNILNI